MRTDDDQDDARPGRHDAHRDAGFAPPVGAVAEHPVGPGLPSLRLSGRRRWQWPAGTVSIGPPTRCTWTRTNRRRCGRGAAGPSRAQPRRVGKLTLEAAGRGYLGQAVEPFAAVDARVTPLSRTGDPADEIIEAALDTHDELIVVDCRGRGRFGGLILGGMSEHVLHGAKVPVLIVC